MRNIHVIPTDKPSRLYKRNDLNSFHLGDFAICEAGDLLRANQNIYITSDEIVTEYSTGLYFIDVYTGRNDVFSPIKIDKESIHAAPFHSYMNNGNMCKRIIMTTDPILISNGVQAIDDEFLEWFVKNPSCEEVEVEHIKVDDARPSGYKIIIPNEEPNMISDWLEQNRNPEIDRQVENEAEQLSKQETLVRDYSNRSCQTCNLFNANNGGEKACELELESECASYSNDETLEDFWISCLDDESDSVLYKQETLEEAAERLSPNSSWKLGFIACAKWQTERMYSAEDIRKLMDEYQDYLFKTNDPIKTFKEWFEQFKKK